MRVVGATLILIAFISMTCPKTFSIEGEIIDADKMPLSGVYITIENSSIPPMDRDFMNYPICIEVRVLSNSNFQL
jgi:hypothetical protein